MNTKKILVVDDDIDIINVYQVILEKEGYKVITAPNKNEGIAIAKKEKPDLMFLDVMMTTHYEGFEMRQELASDPELKDIPVIIQTSVEVLTTNDGLRGSVQDMAVEFRKNPAYKELRVLLVNNLVNDVKGVDYLTEDGKSIYFNVDGFLKKPVSPESLVAAVKDAVG